MIVFDLSCAGGHVFEAWFGSSEDYASQKARHLLACPLCGSEEIGKAVMAPAVGAKGNQIAVRPDAMRGGGATRGAVPMLSGGGSGASGGGAGGGDLPDAAQMKAMLRALADAQARALDGSDYVGGRFAEEARAMHDGLTEHRAIHGQASVAEAKALIDDGVPVAALPLPVRPPGSDN